jgi:WD40 repeat protein
VFQLQDTSFNDVTSKFGAEKRSAVGFSNDGALLAVASETGAIQLWDAHTLSPAAPDAFPVPSPFPGTGRPSYLTILPDKKSLAVSTWGDTVPVRFWNGASWTALSLSERDQMVRLLFSSVQAGGKLGFASLYGRIVAFNPADAFVRDSYITPKIEPIPLQGAPGVPSLSPDATRLVTLSGGSFMGYETIRVWDLRLREPIPNWDKIHLEGNDSPSWLADLCDTVSAIPLTDDEDQDFKTLDEIRLKTPTAQKGEYKPIWDHFFSHRNDG